MYLHRFHVNSVSPKIFNYITHLFGARITTNESLAARYYQRSRRVATVRVLFARRQWRSLDGQQLRLRARSYNY